MLPNLGIIAGRGTLPLEIANAYLNANGKVHILAINNETDLKIISHIPFKIFKIGDMKPLIDYLKDHNIENIIFAGGITRPDLKSIKVDFMGSSLIARILKQKLLGDDKILRVVAKFFEEKGFKVISAQEVLKITSDEKKNYILPSKQDLIDIEIGKKLAKILGFYDIGQSYIIEDGYILGIEAAEGTDNLIKRCSSLRKKPIGGVLVKLMKEGQDKRMDIPSIGPETIKNLIENKYNGIAIQKDGVIIINPEYTYKLANDNNIFIFKL